MRRNFTIIFILILKFSYSQVSDWENVNSLFKVKPIEINEIQRLRIGDTVEISVIGKVTLDNEFIYMTDLSSTEIKIFNNGILNSSMSLIPIDTLYCFYTNSIYQIYLPEFLYDNVTLNIVLNYHATENLVSELIEFLRNSEIIRNVEFLKSEEIGKRDNDYMFGKGKYSGNMLNHVQYKPEINLKIDYQNLKIGDLEKLILRIKSDKYVFDVYNQDLFLNNTKAKILRIKTL